MINNFKIQNFVTNVNDLLELQKASFYRFLLYGITKELNSVIINPFFLISLNNKNSLEIKNEYEKKSFLNVSTLNPTTITNSNVLVENNTKIYQNLNPNSQQKIKTKNFELNKILENENIDLGATTLANIYLYPSKVKIKGPIKSLNSCLEREESYIASIYIQGEIIESANLLPNFYNGSKVNKKKKGVRSIKLTSNSKNYQINKLSIKKYFYLATIPFLTEDGTFFVNGCERVVVNQIVRSPGIYFKKEYLSFQKISYTATFISDNWLWTKFTLDNSSSRVKKINNLIGTSLKSEDFDELEKKINEVPKKYDIYLNLTDSNFWHELSVSKEAKDGSNELFLIDLILALGFTLEEILDALKYPDKLSIPDFLSHSFLLNQAKIDLKSRSENNVLLDSYTDTTDENFEESEKNFAKPLEPILEHILSETEEKIYFSLGELGRYRLNKRLGINLPLSTKYLTALDFIKIIDSLIQLHEENLPSDDIDDLKNKQIRGVGDLVRNQFRLSIFRWLKHPKYSEDSLLEPIIQSKITKKFLKKNFTPLYFSVNSFALSTSLRNSIDKSMREFFLTSQLSQYFDETNPLAELAHKRRISVFGPDGLQRDKISTKIRDIHPSQYGKICPVETPEGENAGLVMSLASFARITQYGWIETPYFLVENGKILKKTKVFYLNSNQEESYKLAFGNNSLDKEGKIIDSSISIKEGPYFSEDEPLKIDFSALSPLQILSIGTILVPFVEHNDANRALMGSNMQRQAVPLLFPSLPLVGTGFEPIVALESGLVIKSEIEGNIDFASSSLVHIKDTLNQKLIYKLRKYRRSNQETVNNQRSIFWPGEKIYAGQILADSSCTVNGELSLGTNLLIGYLPWEGYNYEDAIVINERLITKNLLTSLHISTYQTTVKPTQVVLKKINYLFESSRKIRYFKVLFSKIQKIKATNSKISLNSNKVIKLARQIIENKKLLITRFAEIYYSPEYLIGKEKMSGYLEKGKTYLTRNISSNGIVKIGANIKGGDILVSKVQIIDGSQPKSGYQKLFEDLKPVQNKNLKNKKKIKKKKKLIKKIDFFKIKKEKRKLQRALIFLKRINKNYFKLLLLLKRLNLYSFYFQKFLIELKIQKENSGSTVYANSLSIKYQKKIEDVILLIKKIKLEKRKQNKLGIYVLRLTKLLIQLFYKKLYTNFHLLELKKRKRFIKIIARKFYIKILQTNLKNSAFFLRKLYLKIKLQSFETLRKLYSVSLENPLFENTKIDYSINLLSKLSTKILEIFTFNPKIVLKSEENFFFLQLEIIHRLFGERKNLYRKSKFKLPQNIRYKDTSFIFPLGYEGKVIDIKILPLSVEKEERSLFITGFVTKIYVLEMRKIQIGDKLSGRHGNKGVISRILPNQDMPILPDGKSLDILVNPLGVPSRMNVGQLMECLLGLSSLYLGKRFKIRPFDEVFGVEASRVFVTQKLKEAAISSKKEWLYNDDSPGKFYLRDGRTGEFFDNPVTVGVAYILKLIHLVEDKIHSRALGPYNRVTEQPLQGKSSNGGQRFGEMEVWALEAYGCSNTLQELLTVKSDDIDGRNDVYKVISSGELFEKPNPSFSETLISLIRELNSLGLDFQFFKTSFNSKNILNFSKSSSFSLEEIKIFNLLETRLKLRFKIEELKFRYTDFQTKTEITNLSVISKLKNQKSIIFDLLEKF